MPDHSRIQFLILITFPIAQDNIFCTISLEPLLYDIESYKSYKIINKNFHFSIYVISPLAFVFIDLIPKYLIHCKSVINEVLLYSGKFKMW